MLCSEHKPFEARDAEFFIIFCQELTNGFFGISYKILVQ